METADSNRKRLFFFFSTKGLHASTLEQPAASPPDCGFEYDTHHNKHENTTFTDGTRR